VIARLNLAIQKSGSSWYGSTPTRAAPESQESSQVFLSARWSRQSPSPTPSQTAIQRPTDYSGWEYVWFVLGAATTGLYLLGRELRLRRTRRQATPTAPRRCRSRARRRWISPEPQDSGSSASSRRVEWGRYLVFAHRRSRRGTGLPPHPPRSSAARIATAFGWPAQPLERSAASYADRERPKT
jgi:hypothetical protein